MIEELYEMNSQCSEESHSDSTELPPAKPEEDPCCGEERAGRDEPEISSVSTDMQKELSAEASLDDTTSTSPMDGDGDGVLKEHWPVLEDDNGRERLKRHRTEVAGEVWIPDIWGQEDLLMDWVDCSPFDSPLVLGKIVSARAALVDEGRRANASRLRIESRSCISVLHLIQTLQQTWIDSQLGRGWQQIRAAHGTDCLLTNSTRNKSRNFVKVMRGGLGGHNTECKGGGLGECCLEEYISIRIYLSSKLG